jgi:hypothetical protein
VIQAVPNRKTPSERFWVKVDKRGPDECWPWKAARFHMGHGAFRHDSKQKKAHRVAWEFTYGPIPAGTGYHGTCVCHTCDNPPCCNPAHLFLGSIQANTLDRDRKGRAARQSGEQHGMAKLTKVDVLRIFELRRQPLSQKAIAAEIGISRAYVSEILLGRKWTHLGLRSDKCRIEVEPRKLRSRK